MTENQKKMQEVFSRMEKPMIYLYGRWQDEKEYEDFNDYQEQVKPQIEKLGAHFVKMTKKPFAAYFTLPQVPQKLFYLVVTSREYKCMVKNV